MAHIGKEFAFCNVGGFCAFFGKSEFFKRGRQFSGAFSDPAFQCLICLGKQCRHFPPLGNLFLSLSKESFHQPVLFAYLLFRMIGMKCFGNSQFQVGFFPGLADIAVKVGIVDRIPHGRSVCLTGQKDFQTCRTPLMNPAEQFVSFHSRHDLIRDYDGNLVALFQKLFQYFHGFLTAFRNLDEINISEMTHKLVLETVQDHVFVINA